MQKLFEIATREELFDLLGIIPEDYQPNVLNEHLEQLRSFLDENKDFHWAMLAELYAFWRQDKKNANACLEQIQDTELRLDTQLFIYECPDSPLGPCSKDETGDAETYKFS